MAEVIVQEPIRTVYPDSIVISNVKSKIDNGTTSYTVVTTWYDSTAMDDSKVDEWGIYSKYKSTGEYLRENKPQWGELFLEVDTVSQLRALSSYYQYLIKIGYYKGVRLNGYWVKGDTRKPIEYLLTNSIEADNGGSIFQIGIIKLKHIFVGEVDVRYFGASGVKTQNCVTYCRNAFKYCVDNKIDLYHPTGVYNSFTSNFPYTTQFPDDNILFDCKYIAIKGDGDATILMSETALGADVLNLYKLKNITIRDLSVTGILTSTWRSGTNGISVIGGFDNINIINVSVFDLYGFPKEGYEKKVNKGNWDAATNNPPLSNSNLGTNGDWYTVTVAGTQNFGGSTSFFFDVGDEVVQANGVFWKQSFYIDGGKALTIQNGESPLQLGSLKADIRVRNCGYGFGIDYLNHNFISKKTAIDVTMVAEQCHRAISLDGNFSTTPAPLNKTSNVVVVKCLAVNCQEDAFLRNIIGMDVRVTVTTTKTAEERRKIPDGSRYWNNYNKKVNAIRAYNLMSSNIYVTGDKGECNSKYEIGGEMLPLASGYSGVTQNSNLFLNVLGSTPTPFNLVNAGGNFIKNSVLSILSESLDDLPDLLFWSTRGNVLTTKDGIYNSYNKTNRIALTNTDSKTNLAEIKYEAGLGVSVRQTGGASPESPILSWKNSSGTVRVQILNEGSVRFLNAQGGDFKIMTGELLPEGNIIANPTSLYLRASFSGGSFASGSVWIKQFGTGNTGWRRLDGDASATEKGLVYQSAYQANFTASDLPTLITQLNQFLTKYRTSGQGASS